MLLIKLNEDKQHVQEVRQALNDNQGFCPCSLIKNHDTKCMCKEFRTQQGEGFCHYGLYYKENK